MTDEQLSNFDHNVINALQDFPKNQEDGVFYIRVKVSPDKMAKYFWHTKSNFDTATKAIFILLNREEIRPSVLNAMLNFFKQNKDEIADFSEYLRQIKNDRL